jgi:hypothetical protein
MKESGVIALVPLLIIIIIGLVLAVFVYINLIGKVNLQITDSKPASTDKPEQVVSLKSEYKNPFEKDTQYVNPFSEYKNPFDNL